MINPIYTQKTLLHSERPNRRPYCIQKDQNYRPYCTQKDQNCRPFRNQKAQNCIQLSECNRVDNVSLKVYVYTAILTLKAPIITAADDIHKYFFIVFFSEKVRLDVSSESSARQRIHLKHQALFSSKDKRKQLKCRLLQFLFGALRVNPPFKKGPTICHLTG